MSRAGVVPYRPCAGMMLANREGKILVGQRIDNPDSDAWQMPQGGIDDDEEPEAAALRELAEETGVTADKVEIVARAKEELYYDLPPELLGNIWGGKYCGQRQWWFLARFIGEDADIDIATDHPEFRAWRWADPAELPEMIVPFKRKLYRDLVEEFGPLI